MSEVGNLGCESIGSKESSHAYYLGYKACPTGNFRILETLIQLFTVVKLIKLCSYW